MLASAFSDVVWWSENRPMPRDRLIDSVAEADGLYCMLTDQVDAELISRAPRLRVISQMAVGVDNIDLAACTARRIRLGHTPDVLTETTADLGMALMLAAARRIGEGAARVKAGTWGDWDPGFQLGRDFHGASLGIVGMGRVGLAVARRARGFGMDIVYHNRHVRPGAEVVDANGSASGNCWRSRTSCFSPVRSPRTRVASSMPRPSTRCARRLFSSNLARGPVVDSDALAEALQSGGIWAAALDVTDPEPLPRNHPLVSLPNCLIVPHIGSATIQARAAMAELAAQNLIEGLGGRPMPSEHPATIT